MSVQTSITNFFGARKRTIGELDEGFRANKTDSVAPLVKQILVETQPTKKRKLEKIVREKKVEKKQLEPREVIGKDEDKVSNGRGKAENTLEEKLENTPVGKVTVKVEDTVAESVKTTAGKIDDDKGRKRLTTAAKLEEFLEQEKRVTASPSTPKIKSFDEIVLEVPTTPLQTALSPTPLKSHQSASLLGRATASPSPLRLRRALFKSPVKEKPSGDGFENQLASEIRAEQSRRQLLSPKKVLESILAAGGQSKEAGSGAFASTSSPAFERHYRLASAGVVNLCLPGKYSALAEIFKAVDACVSIMFSRKEPVMFDRLRSSVQRMVKKNLTEGHLSQIMTVMETAYSFERRTVRKFGAQSETTELFVKPIFDSKDAKGFSPEVILERNRKFRENLLNRVHAEHEKFLKRLIPPLNIPREKLTRWHPEFDVDRLCPEIAPCEKFPPVPEKNKFSSARDVLSKARDVFGANARLEKALQKVASAQSNDPTQPTAAPTVLAPAPPPPASSTIPAIANALKGLPKSILEKVRARQAAKTVELLTRSSQETKKRIELTRLPEICRMLRYQYILERRNVLPMHTVLTRLVESYREIMTQEEMKRHLQLIEKSVPGWLVIINDDNKEYVKVAKDADLQKVMARLNDLIVKNPVSI